MGHHHDVPVPRKALIAAALLIVTSITIAATAKHGGIVGAERAAHAPRAHVSLVFRDRAEGGVEVRNAESGKLLDVFEPGTNGFARQVVRGMVRDRRQRGLNIEAPFELGLHADGRLTFRDPETGRNIELVSFGKDNVSVFAAYLRRGDEKS